MQKTQSCTIATVHFGCVLQSTVASKKGEKNREKKGNEKRQQKTETERDSRVFTPKSLAQEKRSRILIEKKSTGFRNISSSAVIMKIINVDVEREKRQMAPILQSGDF